MKYLKINNSTLIFSFTILMLGCNFNQDCNGCGGCRYETFEETFVINNIDKTDKTNYKIQFVNTNNADFKFELNKSYIKVALPEFSDSLMNSPNQVYRIKGDKIISGSCAPENIHEIELKN